MERQEQSKASSTSCRSAQHSIQRMRACCDQTPHLQTAPPRRVGSGAAQSRSAGRSHRCPAHLQQQDIARQQQQDSGGRTAGACRCQPAAAGGQQQAGGQAGQSRGCSPYDSNSSSPAAMARVAVTTISQSPPELPPLPPPLPLVGAFRSHLQAGQGCAPAKFSKP